jgi:hypothetical protein
MVDKYTAARRDSSRRSPFPAQIRLQARLASHHPAARGPDQGRDQRLAGLTVGGALAENRSQFEAGEPAAPMSRMSRTKAAYSPKRYSYAWIGCFSGFYQRLT